MHEKLLNGPPLKNLVQIKSLGETLFESAVKNGDKVFQIDADIDTSETFKSAKERSVTVAVELQNRGITSEDHVVFCSSNFLDQTIPILAALYLGAKVANIDASLSVEVAKKLLSLVNPKIIFVEESSISFIEQSLGNLEPQIVVYGKSDKYPTLADFLKVKGNEDRFIPKKVNVDDTALLFFSSGTTGIPKAICHSHRSFLFLLNQFKEMGFNTKSYLTLCGFSWISGMMFFIFGFSNGGCRIISKLGTPNSIFQIIHKYKVTFLFLRPLLTYDLASVENIDQYDTSSVEVLCTGGNKVVSSLLRKTGEILKYTKVFSGYGMTEVGMISCFKSDVKREYLNEKLSSCGPIVAGATVKIVDLDDDNNILGPNKKGEIRIKMQSAMTGYYKLSNADPFDEEGFVKSGDIGYYDEEGLIYITGRIKEMLRYCDVEISPSVIESVLMEHTAVKDAVVYGIPVKEGEMPAAKVVLRPGFYVEEKDIEEYVASKVSETERLAGGVMFVEEVPRTASGKVIRQIVR